MPKAKYLKIGNLCVILPPTIKLEPRPFLGLTAISGLSAPHLVQPLNRWSAALYQTQLQFFWAMSDGAPHKSYQDAWLFNGPEDPMD
jgi:hypothetical protein